MARGDTVAGGLERVGWWIRKEDGRGSEKK